MKEKHKFIKLLVINFAAILFVMTAIFVLDDKNLVYTSGIAFLTGEVGFLLGKAKNPNEEDKGN